MASKNDDDSLQVVMEDAALAAAKELRDFLQAQDKSAKPTERISVALGTVSGYTRWRASENNLISMKLTIARHSNMAPKDVIDMSRTMGLLPDKIKER